MLSEGASAPTMLLSPRPLARTAGRIQLLPLLPYRPEPKPLPSEVWTKILADVFAHYDLDASRPRAECDALKKGLLLICKELKSVALPLFYARVCIASLHSLERFAAHIFSSDQKWDSIRRIPYSTPGRWVNTLDLRDLDIHTLPETFRVDTLLTYLFPVLPFLDRFMLSPTIVLSRRATLSLISRSEIIHLHTLKGLKLESYPSIGDDCFVDLLRACVNLEELTIVGSGVEVSEGLEQDHSIPASAFKPLVLRYLHKLVLLSMPCSPAMYALLHAQLPSLRHLTITPYDGDIIPTSLVPQFIRAHGQTLQSLHLYTTKTWPATLHPSPSTLLQDCPNLSHLSLENPLPILMLSSADPPHPLHILSIPRPYPEFLAVLDALLPKLPALRILRARDVRWIRPGMSLRAQQAGVQGEMVEWRRRLSRRGVQVVDSEWKRGTL
ncbi:hypothetical protein WOLCODRAFT_135465 [Wolfiporia cocos MD-104 SS10]|uniref:F-box domain-containing protein n=1 Tax=Wolfiporia cocos (strain MD-104) TaxID=742152 RepID=A0A2H3J2N1_WOLCO|nr:hypothetical protein WOLCODRAFT_135465 [Wolfiporia cocos MD-104 SS10]